MFNYASLCSFLSPPRCLACDISVTDAGQLCADCFNQCAFIYSPLCAWCGYPLEVCDHDSKNTLCLSCIRRRPPYISRAALCYDDFSKDLSLQLKYCDRLDMAPLLARFLYQALRPHLHTIEYFIPVPLHWQRLWKRRYNQATELSHHLSALIMKFSNHHIPVVSHNLRRFKMTEPQGSKSPRQRLDNMRNAFYVHNPEKLAGKHVALIDDVYTSGATLKSCATALKKAGVNSIFAFTVARVIKGQE